MVVGEFPDAVTLDGSTDGERKCMKSVYAQLGVPYSHRDRNGGGAAGSFSWCGRSRGHRPCVCDHTLCEPQMLNVSDYCSIRYCNVSET